MALRCIISILWEYVYVYRFHTVEALELLAYNGLICNLTDSCIMLSFDVSFDKTKRIISVRADSVYKCVEISLIGGTKDTLSRAFQ